MKIPFALLVWTSIAVGLHDDDPEFPSLRAVLDVGELSTFETDSDLGALQLDLTISQRAGSEQAVALLEQYNLKHYGDSPPSFLSRASRSREYRAKAETNAILTDCLLHQETVYTASGTSTDRGIRVSLEESWDWGYEQSNLPSYNRKSPEGKPLEHAENGCLLLIRDRRRLSEMCASTELEWKLRDLGGETVPIATLDLSDRAHAARLFIGALAPWGGAHLAGGCLEISLSTNPNRGSRLLIETWYDSNRHPLLRSRFEWSESTGDWRSIKQSRYNAATGEVYFNQELMIQRLDARSPFLKRATNWQPVSGSFVNDTRTDPIANYIVGDDGVDAALRDAVSDRLIKEVFAPRFSVLSSGGDLLESGVSVCLAGDEFEGISVWSEGEVVKGLYGSMRPVPFHVRNNSETMAYVTVASTSCDCIDADLEDAVVEPGGLSVLMATLSFKTLSTSDSSVSAIELDVHHGKRVERIQIPFRIESRTPDLWVSPGFLEYEMLVDDSPKPLKVVVIASEPNSSTGAVFDLPGCSLEVEPIRSTASQTLFALNKVRLDDDFVGSAVLRGTVSLQDHAGGHTREIFMLVHHGQARDAYGQRKFCKAMRKGVSELRLRGFEGSDKAPIAIDLIGGPVANHLDCRLDGQDVVLHVINGAPLTSQAYNVSFKDLSGQTVSLVVCVEGKGR